MNKDVAEKVTGTPSSDHKSSQPLEATVDQVQVIERPRQPPFTPGSPQTKSPEAKRKKTKDEKQDRYLEINIYTLFSIYLPKTQRMLCKALIFIPSTVLLGAAEMLVKKEEGEIQNAVEEEPKVMNRNQRYSITYILWSQTFVIPGQNYIRLLLQISNCFIFTGRGRKKKRRRKERK